MPINTDPLMRSLPEIPDVIAKIQSGVYRLDGGVVRHAAGTSKGGQIIGHLLFPGDSQQTQERLQQLQSTLSSGFESLQTGVGQLQKSMSVLQSLQSANLVLSGLNLAVTAVGFVIVCKKLDGISAQIQAQSHSITQTLQLVGDIQERNLLADEAQFRALTLAARQFCDQGDVEHLKGLIAPFHKEYQFTKLVLEKHAPIAASSVERLNEIRLLQDRLINLGLMLSYIQMKTRAVKHSRDCVVQLESDLADLNDQRVEALSNDRALASKITHEQLTDMTDFLKQGKLMLPALSYQADVIGLEILHPGVLERASGSKEIMLIAV